MLYDLELISVGKTYPDGTVAVSDFDLRVEKGEFVAYFCYNAETMFWTEGYTSKASAKNAIESLKKNGPGAEIVDKSGG